MSPGLDMDWAASYSTAREYRPNERYMLFREGGQTLNFTGTSDFPNFNTVGFDATEAGLNTISENTD
ncbi:MAG: hypothetical protein EOO88_29940, partial [Pedobacter sp.]